jgi:FecR protein
MKGLALLFLVPAALLAGTSRYARLGEFQGKVEVQLSAADPWMPAERNLPLTESAWVRTGAGARVEIEMDDGSAWRLGPDSLGELSDYTQLSTGQRITLLSLDHGVAYFTGEPIGKDVMMLVAPGAQATLTQGARVRVSAQPDWSQFSVLEGVVRFSSPTAEMGLREGQSARVEPANVQHFYLYPQIARLPLDEWSEGRDKAEAVPVSAAHVTWHAGLADLDTNGDWIQNDDLGMVWKPKQTQDWAPYQKGRWRYSEVLGYTWVSDDDWGWVPYHNGRWARIDSVGWVWQPAVSTVFKPGEVYWLRGTGMAGWGPLGPGEDWNASAPGATPPRYFTSGITSFGPFQQDVRVIDPQAFPVPTPAQLQASFYTRSLPSPAFIAARLDATRPVLKVGRTRIDPVVPGVTLPDPPDPTMSNPPSEAYPANGGTAADVPPPPPPPDGVYPVPVVAVPVVEVPVVVNPSDHPSYSRIKPGAPPNGITGGATTQGTQQTQQQTNGAGGSTQASQTVRNTNTQPVHEHAQTGGQTTTTTSTTVSPTVRPPQEQPTHERVATTTPAAPARETQKTVAPPAAPRVETPKIDTPKVDPAKTKNNFLGSAEANVYQKVMADFNAVTPNYQKSLEDLDTWTRDYPNSEKANDRQYYYIQAYNGLARPDRVLDAARRPIAAGARQVYSNAEQILQSLLLTTASLAKIGQPSALQMETGQAAARQLLDYLPEYFAPQHKPPNVTDSSWQLARTQVENLGKLTLVRKSSPILAGK